MRLAPPAAAVLAAAVLGAGPAAAAGAQSEAGLAMTVGSGGYSRVAGSLDVEASEGTVRPYGWAEAGRDDDARRLSLGLGAWNAVDERTSVKAGVGGSIGRYEDSDLDGGSVTFEAGAETLAGEGAVGGDYRLTVGSIADARAAPRVSRAADARGRGRKARGESAERFSVHAWSGYGRVPVGVGRLGLRVTVTKPSYSDVILSETVSYRFPVAPQWRLTPALTFEQGDEEGVYGTLSVSYLF